MKNKMQVFMLCAVIILAVAVMIFMGRQYLSARKELSSLKIDLETSTAAWKKTNEEKLEVQKELKAVKNDLREAQVTIEESEERAETLRKDIETLEKEILEIKTALPEMN